MTAKGFLKKQKQLRTRSILIFNLVVSLLFSFGCASTSPVASSDKQKAAGLKMEIGIAHIQNNNLPLALKELLGAVELDPNNSAIHNNLGIVYYLREKFDLAIKYFTEAVRLNKTFTEAKNNLARVYIEQKQYSKALPLLQDVVGDLTYTNADSGYFNYGLYYFNQSKFEDAKKYFLKILARNREDCLTQVYYARTLMETSFIKQASDQLEKSLPSCIEARADDGHFYSAIAYYRLGKIQQSLVRFGDVEKLFPNGKHHLESIQMIKLILKDKK